MTSIEKDLLRLAESGISLTAKNGSLHWKAKKGLVTDKMRKWCADHKEEILQVLLASSPAAAAAAPVVPTPVQDQSFANLSYLTMSDTRLLDDDEAIQIAITLTNIGLIFSETGPFVAPIGPFPFAECPTLTKEQVISFIFRHESLLLDWIQRGRPGATIPKPRTPRYVAAQKFYAAFCARPGYYLKMRDDGDIRVGVPAATSDEKGTEIEQLVESFGTELVQVIKDASSAGEQSVVDSEPAAPSHLAEVGATR
jgi:hypothetical protein